MEQPLVSIIMSVYNSEKWLQGTIESILNQTYKNWEFIIIDDASKDNGRQILEEYKEDKRFKIIFREKNVGYVKNLNYALDFCSGKYIARMDADDISLSHRLEKQVAFLESNENITLVAGFIDFIDEENNYLGVWDADRKYITPNAIRNRLPFENCIAHPSILIRSNILKEFRYNELQTSSEDWDLWLQLSASGYKIGKIGEPLLLYRKHSNSVTATSLSGSAFRKNNNTYKKYLQLVLEKNKFSIYNFKVFFAYCINGVKLFLSNVKRKLRL